MCERHLLACMQVWILTGRQQDMYRDMWVAAMDDMANRLVRVSSEGFKYVGQMKGCAPFASTCMGAVAPCTRRHYVQHGAEQVKKSRRLAETRRPHKAFPLFHSASRTSRYRSTPFIESLGARLCGICWRFGRAQFDPESTGEHDTARLP